ncbi:MAG TPA: glycosyltransferase [Fervidobacterium nodosum]|nr:glycosyltransferase [Fervidobacterium nodosum]
MTALLYQNELENNSLLQKLSKSFSKIGLDVVVIGVKRITKSLDESAMKVEFLSNQPVQKIRYYEISLPLEYGGGVKSWKGVIKYQLMSYKVLQEQKKNIDIVYAIDLLMALPAAIFSIFARKKFIYHIADKFTKAYNVPFLIKPFFDFIDFLIMTKAEYIIIPSETRIYDIPRIFRKKCTIIYNSPEDVKNIQAEINDKINDRLKLGFFGVLSEDRFIKETCEIVKKNDFLELHIGGYGPLESYIREQSLLCERIKFYGKVAYDKVLEIQSEVDLLFAIYNPAIPNNKQASPNKLYEAMMLRKPIIVCRGMGIDELVEREDIGFVINYSANDFEKLLAFINNQRCILKSKGAKARTLYENNYSWNLMEQKILQIIKSLREK